MADDCPWLERVSAMVDGELDDHQVELVRAHASNCRSCGQLSAMSGTWEMPAFAPKRHLREFPDRLSPLVRWSLVVVGLLILAASMPDFIRGNTMGDALHDLRHLAIWQTSIGVAVLTASVTFRMSRLLTTMIVTFLFLTVGAAVYDLSTGHRGPWTDPTHIVEVVAVVLVFRLVWPHLRLGWMRPPSRTRSD